jgi:AcrR family transcriptional regulator
MDETRKASSTRQMIAARALRLAQERGAPNVTVTDIATAARVSVRTVYNYFPSASHAILGLHPAHAHRLAERLARRPPDERPLQALARATVGTSVGPNVWRARSEIAGSDPQIYAAYMGSFAEINQHLTIAMGQRLRVDPDVDPYPGLLVTSGLASFRFATEHVIANAGPVSDEDEVTERILEAIDHAVFLLEAGFPRI